VNVVFSFIQVGFLTEQLSDYQILNKNSCVELLVSCNEDNFAFKDQLSLTAGVWIKSAVLLSVLNVPCHWSMKSCVVT
jgi:hypothetical protein